MSAAAGEPSTPPPPQQKGLSHFSKRGFCRVSTSGGKGMRRSKIG